MLPPERTKPEFQGKSLQTNDIHGCAVSTKGLGNFHTRKRRAFLTTNVTEDIQGAQPDTVKKAPVTLRNTNPLVPDYQYPGRLDLENKNDGYSTKINNKSSNTLQKSAQQSLGINEGSKLYTASRKESNQVNQSGKAPSEKAGSVHGSQAAASVKFHHSGIGQTNAQKLDKFIGS